jgi:signal transduction histidine kinase
MTDLKDSEKESPPTKNYLLPLSLLSVLSQNQFSSIYYTSPVEVETLEERPSRMRTHEQVQRRQRYLAHLPWWRKPLWGYLLALPFTALSMLIPLLFEQIGVQRVFVTPLVFLVTVLIAWIWGTGPAIVAIVLSVLALNYLFLPPRGSLKWEWPGVLTILTFLLAELVVVLIIAGRESARQELQEHTRELEEANQTKDRFLSMASHELKTPLTLIRTQVQFILRRLTKQKEAPPEAAGLREPLEQVNQQTHHLQGLIQDILDLSILGAKQMPLRIERCDLSTCCREIIEALRASSGRSIVLQVPPTPVMLDADCERIGQVVINLVTNAIKYSPEASTILIAISQSENSVTIQVHNDGQAIPSQQQEHLFEPFYRTPNVRSSPKEGSGLGLAISKEIVVLHNGRIWVESSPEKGTSFFVQLPLNASPS